MYILEIKSILQQYLAGKQLKKIEILALAFFSFYVECNPNGNLLLQKFYQKKELGGLLHFT